MIPPNYIRGNSMHREGIVFVTSFRGVGNINFFFQTHHRCSLRVSTTDQMLENIGTYGILFFILLE